MQVPLILLAVLLVTIPAASFAQQGDFKRDVANAAQEDAEVAGLPDECKQSLRDSGYTKCWTNWSDTLTFGVGVPALSFRFDGKIGLLDQIAPLEISFNRMQRRDVSTSNNRREIHDFVFWRVALGLRILKRAGSSDVGFGAYVMPWGIRIDKFSFGVALGYETEGTLKGGHENFSILVPVTYALAF